MIILEVAPFEGVEEWMIRGGKRQVIHYRKNDWA
jgi:hypothetical protein